VTLQLLLKVCHQISRLESSTPPAFLAAHMFALLYNLANRRRFRRLLDQRKAAEIATFG
jgi:hypothetical protein